MINELHWVLQNRNSIITKETILWTLTNLCCNETISNMMIQLNDGVYEQVLYQFRSSKYPNIKYEALNFLITLINNCTVDHRGTLRVICKELMESIYEELTEIEDDKLLQIIILEALSHIFTKFKDLKI